MMNKSDTDQIYVSVLKFNRSICHEGELIKLLLPNTPVIVKFIKITGGQTAWLLDRHDRDIYNFYGEQ